ncbi:nicotinate-nucleotide--dimethylbenzimidazole phosphoribosyltransferase [Halobacteriales archaeon Cl-PHB]
MRFVLVGGTTETAAIDGISAAGASSALLAHTPSADAEILVYGQPVRAPVVPVSPTGCPTPAVATRAVRELLDFPVTVLDAGMAKPTGAPTVGVGADTGGDVRDAEPVPTAEAAFDDAREFGRQLPEDRVFVGETIPGGTTTALGVLRALGETGGVSSSLPDNPRAQKRAAVDEGFAASDLAPGEAAGDPLLAVRRMGDPVLATVAGLVRGALESNTDVLLAGGTQLLAAAALVRHDGIDAPLTVATTSFVAADESAAPEALAESLSVDLRVTDPGFGRLDHPATNAYRRGEAKEGVGMGGALALAEDEGVLDAVPERFGTLTDRLTGEASATHGGTGAGGPPP